MIRDDEVGIGGWEVMDLPLNEDTGSMEIEKDENVTSTVPEKPASREESAKPECAEAVVTKNDASCRPAKKQSTPTARSNGNKSRKAKEDKSIVVLPDQSSFMACKGRLNAKRTYTKREAWSCGIPHEVISAPTACSMDYTAAKSIRDKCGVGKKGRGKRGGRGQREMAMAF